MIENLGGVTSDVARLALDALSLRHELISHNIANARTPGYVPKRLEFSARLHALVDSLQHGIDQCVAPCVGLIGIDAYRARVRDASAAVWMAVPEKSDIRSVKDLEGKRIATEAVARVLVMAFEELGPTYIKLVQILSTRPDLIPVEFIEELSKLQDEVAPFSFDEVGEVVQSEFGVPHEDLFESLDKQPLASASIGQVHAALTTDGRDLALKIQYPGVARAIDSDVNNLASMLRMTRVLPVDVDISEIVAEAKRQLKQEADYQRGRDFLFIG